MVFVCLPILFTCLKLVDISVMSLIGYFYFFVLLFLCHLNYQYHWLFEFLLFDFHKFHAVDAITETYTFHAIYEIHLTLTGPAFQDYIKWGGFRPGKPTPWPNFLVLIILSLFYIYGKSLPLKPGCSSPSKIRP